MPLFTVEVADRPVLVFSEASRESAQDILWSAYRAGPAGIPIRRRAGWDGEAPLPVRDANPVETTPLGAGPGGGAEDSAGEEEGRGDGDDFAVFLIELDEEGEEEDDEEA